MQQKELGVIQRRLPQHVRLDVAFIEAFRRSTIAWVHGQGGLKPGIASTAFISRDDHSPFTPRKALSCLTRPMSDPKLVHVA